MFRRSLRFFGTYAPDTMLILRSTNKEVFLVGTAHGSATSAAQVREVISNVAPDVVVLELCATRAALVNKQSNRPGQLFPERLLKGFGSLQGPLEAYLAMMSQVFARLGSDVGIDFVAAFDECQKRGIPIELGDQDIAVTTRKLQGAVSPSDLMKIYANRALIFTQEDIDSIGSVAGSPENRETIRALMRLCRKVSPKLVEVVLDERDAVLCRSLKNAKGKRVVGVVSLQHLEGIERLWDKQ